MPSTLLSVLLSITEGFYIYNKTCIYYLYTYNLIRFDLNFLFYSRLILYIFWILLQLRIIGFPEISNGNLSGAEGRAGMNYFTEVLGSRVPSSVATVNCSFFTIVLLAPVVGRRAILKCSLASTKLLLMCNCLLLLLHINTSTALRTHLLPPKSSAPTEPLS